jgi:carboxymethylenebutenolidase
MSAPLTEMTPSGPPRGGVVVIQEAFGITDYLTGVLADLAGAGWHAVAPHLFHRSGDPVFGYDEYDKIAGIFASLDAGAIAADVDDALAALERSGLGASRTAIIGFCMGGNVATVTATRHALGAAVSFYGGGVAAGRFGHPPLVEAARGLKTPWLGLYGETDPSIPVEEAEQLRAAAAASGVESELILYPEAGHGFHCHDRKDYAPTAAADAWSRMLAWLDRHVAPA